MKFSETFKVTREADDDWFDPVLSIDTKLFLDPFLLYADEKGHFEGSHEEIIAFFNSVFQLIARSKGDRQSLLWKKAVATLVLPEVQEICLGYAGGGTGGSGSGPQLAATVAEAMWDAVQAGLTEITHFEEVGILREGIGADRISDATAAILRWRLGAYTADVCNRHGIPTEEFKYLRGRYNLADQRWEPLKLQLPRNLYNNKGVLLVPDDYLRELPTMNAEDFWDYAVTNENETLRNEFNFDVAANVSKADIVAFARKHPGILTDYVSQREQRPSRPYNVKDDPRGLLQWYDAAKQYVGQHPLTLPVLNVATFVAAVRQMQEQFKHFVEENGGWKLLWNDNNTPRREESSQLLFLGVVKHYCATNNIDITREADVGRGTVDFKASSGYALRALLEVKLAKNGRFWNGLEKQLPTYLKAEAVGFGSFVVIVYTENELKAVKALTDRVRKLNDSVPFTIDAVVVDARRDPTPASKL